MAINLPNARWKTTTPTTKLRIHFEERWPTSEWFRSGMIWNVGAGKVYYFRPGHDTYPIFRQDAPLRNLTNATRWLAVQQREKSTNRDV